MYIYIHIYIYVILELYWQFSSGSGFPERSCSSGASDAAEQSKRPCQVPGNDNNNKQTTTTTAVVELQLRE